jgi:hypothetical protein
MLLPSPKGGSSTIKSSFGCRYADSYIGWETHSLTLSFFGNSEIGRRDESRIENRYVSRIREK